jgi:hypothetical protein
MNCIGFEQHRLKYGPPTLGLESQYSIYTLMGVGVLEALRIHGNDLRVLVLCTVRYFKDQTGL